MKIDVSKIQCRYCDSDIEIDEIEETVVFKESYCQEDHYSGHSLTDFNCAKLEHYFGRSTEDEFLNEIADIIKELYL